MPATKAKKDKKAPTTGEILFDIIEMSSVLFRDSAGLAWARINGECYPVRSTSFKRHIQRKFYHLEGKAPHTQAIQEAIEQAEGKALFESNFNQNVHVRTAFFDSKILLDLGDDSKTIAEISKDGYKGSTTERTFFYRPNGLEALPIPEDGNIDELKSFLNFETKSDFRLIVCWMLAALHPGIACPILILQGEQGSAKSTTSKIIRALTDPNAAPIRTAPRDERELIIQGENARLICLDNLSGLKPWLSDALCRICTGGGFSARKLYTDNEEKIFQIRRPIILNGIDDIATRGDLLDRSIVLNLPAIPSNQRKDEKTFWNEFETVKPKIFGALLRGLCHGLAYQDEIQLSKLPRMADFARWAAACGKAYDWINVVNEYHQNRNTAVETGLDSDILASSIRKILNGISEWSGTATELIEKIENVSGDVDSRYLPTTRTLKSRLTRLSPALRQIGITWHRQRESAGMIYTIKKQPQKPTFDTLDTQSTGKAFSNNGLGNVGSNVDNVGTGKKPTLEKQPTEPLNGDYVGNVANVGTEQEFLKEEMKRLEGYPFDDEEAPF